MHHVPSAWCSSHPSVGRTPWSAVQLHPCSATTTAKRFQCISDGASTQLISRASNARLAKVRMIAQPWKAMLMLRNVPRCNQYVAGARSPV